MIGFSMRFDYDDLVKWTAKLLKVSHDFCYIITCVPCCAILSNLNNSGTTRQNVVVLKSFPNVNMCHYQELSKSTLFYTNSEILSFIFITDKMAVLSDHRTKNLFKFTQIKDLKVVINKPENEAEYNKIQFYSLNTIDNSTLINSEYLQRSKTDLATLNIKKVLNLL